MFKSIEDRLDALIKGLEELEKKVRSENYNYETSSSADRASMEPAGSTRRYQGGDPRHTARSPKTRSGEVRAPSVDGGMPHTGVSTPGLKIRSKAGNVYPHEDAEKAKKKELLDGQEELMKPKDKAAKADLGEYWKKPKRSESEAPTIHYGGGSNVSRRPGTPEVEAGFKVPKDKVESLKNPSFQSKLVQQRRSAGIKKSDEDRITSELLTKSMKLQKSDAEITEMLKSAMDQGQIHRNIFLEWQNFGTINPSILGLVSEE